MPLFTKNSLYIGRFFGVPVRVDISLVILSIFQFIKQKNFVYGLLITAAILLAIFFHDLGHILVGRIFGVRVREITLMFFGGCPTLYCTQTNLWKEAIIAASGPATGGILWYLCPILAEITDAALIKDFLYLVSIVSGSLAVFNLIPAFPMDGGRIFRSILSVYKGNSRATIISCKVAYLLAFGLGIMGLIHSNSFFVVIALLAVFSARNELRAVNR